MRRYRLEVNNRPKDPTRIRKLKVNLGYIDEGGVENHFVIQDKILRDGYDEPSLFVIYDYESWEDFASSMERSLTEIDNMQNPLNLPGRAKMCELQAGIRRARMEGGKRYRPIIDGSSFEDTRMSSRHAGFYANATFEEFVAKLRRGDQDMTRIVEKHSLEIMSASGVLVPVKEPRPSVRGPEVLIEKLMQGDPECTFEINETDDTSNSYGKVVELAVRLDANCGISTTAGLYRGAAIVALVDVLQNLGFSVGLSCYMTFISRDWRQVAQQQIRVKDQNQPFDVDAMTVALCDMDVMRRAGFLMLEDEMGADKHCIGGPWSGWSMPGMEVEALARAKGRAKTADGHALGPNEHPFFKYPMLVDGNGALVEIGAAMPYSQTTIPSIGNWAKEALGRSEYGFWDKSAEEIATENGKWLIKKLKGFGIDADQKKEVKK